MEEFGCRQNERDERRHAEGNKAQAVEFVSRYYSDIDLISLCAVVAMHNDLFFIIHARCTGTSIVSCRRFRI